MQADKKETEAAAPAAAGKPPSICDRLQRAFHARPAFRPLRRLTVRHQDGGAAKPADAGAGAAPGPAPKHNGPPSPPVPAPPQLLTPSPAPAGGAPAATAPPAPRPVPVRLPAVAEASVPPGPPVPVPPPDVTGGVATPAHSKAGDKAQQTKGKSRVGSRVRKALSSKVERRTE